jgi:hypothetical protein
MFGPRWEAEWYHGPLWRKVQMKDPCVYCGAVVEGLDHIVSKAQGGADGWTNRAPACRSCDIRKGNVPLLQWLHATHFAQEKVRRREAEGRRDYQSCRDRRQEAMHGLRTAQLRSLGIYAPQTRVR